MNCGGMPQVVESGLIASAIFPMDAGKGPKSGAGGKAEPVAAAKAPRAKPALVEAPIVTEDEPEMDEAPAPRPAQRRRPPAA